MILNNLKKLRSGALRSRCGLLASLVSALVISLPLQAAADPPFDSTADTVFDIITNSDPSSFICLSYEGRTIRQMWDKRRDNEFDLNVYLFRAFFGEGPAMDIIVNPEFGSQQAARDEVDRYTTRLGQLPLVFRHGIRQFGIHKGNPTFSAGPGKVFVYAGKTTQRIEENHLEESLMHEAVHATLDARYARSPEWQAAQESDGGFVTRYGKRHPQGEDLAESALFAYGLLRHPGRIPPVDSRVIAQTIPARIEFIAWMLEQQPQLAPAPTPPGNCS